MTFDQETRALLEQALEALERAERDGGWSIVTTKAIAALRCTLNQPTSCPHGMVDTCCENYAKCVLEQQEHCQCAACKDGVLHYSDCAVHNKPALPNGPYDCGAQPKPQYWTRKQIGYEREFCEKPFTTDWEPLYTRPQPAVSKEKS